MPPRRRAQCVLAVFGGPQKYLHPHLATDRVPGQCQGSMGIGYCTFGANLARLKNRPRFPRKRMVKRAAFVFAQAAVADQNPLARKLNGSRGLENATWMGQIGPESSPTYQCSLKLLPLEARRPPSARPHGPPGWCWTRPDPSRLPSSGGPSCPGC